MVGHPTDLSKLNATRLAELPQQGVRVEQLRALKPAFLALELKGEGLSELLEELKGMEVAVWYLPQACGFRGFFEMCT